MTRYLIYLGPADGDPHEDWTRLHAGESLSPNGALESYFRERSPLTLNRDNFRVDVFEATSDGRPGERVFHSTDLSSALAAVRTCTTHRLNTLTHTTIWFEEEGE